MKPGTRIEVVSPRLHCAGQFGIIVAACSSHADVLLDDGGTLNGIHVSHLRESDYFAW